MLTDSLARTHTILNLPLDDQTRRQQEDSLCAVVAALDVVDTLIAAGSPYVVHELGRHTEPLPASEFVVWASLARPRDPATRPWLTLLDDEVEPRLLEGAEPFLVLWSSLWPDLPDATIRFDIYPAAEGCQVRGTLLTSGPVPGESRLTHLRRRLAVLLNEHLRHSYGP